MTLPRITDREEWLRARRELLAEEKELTRRRDALATKRRELPMVEIDAPYRFVGPDGEVSLLDLFEGRRQLIVYHFMFAPEWERGCPSCSAGIDEFSAGLLEHLHSRDTTYAMTSRAPFEKLDRFRREQGWEVPWFSTVGDDFHLDLGATIDESRRPAVFNYRTRAEEEELGSDLFDSEQPFDMPGLSCFLRVDDRVFHTYSTYARGLEQASDSYGYLDLTALGRQEDWEEPRGRSDAPRPGSPDFSS